MSHLCSLLLPVCVSVIDSSEPLAHATTPTVCVSVIDSSEPLAHTTSAAAERTTSREIESANLVFAGPSTSAASECGPSLSSASTSGASGRRKHLYVEEIKAQWSLLKVYHTLGTHDQCIAFAEERELIPKSKICTYHKKEMTLEKNGQMGSFRCRKGKCRSKCYSRAAGTWFEQARMRDGVLSTKTIADWYNYCREAITVYLLEHEEDREKIGGPGKIVQVDESKFGRRKYNRGRNVEGHWVLGMIEDGSDGLRVEVCPNNERTAEVLVPVIKKHVREGTSIHTDYWRAYDCLPEHGYVHKKVNHSDLENKFVAPDGTHTQRIESHWRVLKRLFSKDNYKENFGDFLMETIWRRNIKLSYKDL